MSHVVQAPADLTLRLVDEAIASQEQNASGSKNTRSTLSPPIVAAIQSTRLLAASDTIIDECNEDICSWSEQQAVHSTRLAALNFGSPVCTLGTESCQPAEL